MNYKIIRNKVEEHLNIDIETLQEKEIMYMLELCILVYAENY